MATKGAIQIKNSVIMALEAEKDAIVKLSNDYSKNNDPKLANQINKLNLHMHAKIAVLSQQLPKEDVDVLDKIQDESNKAVEEAASKNKMKVEYVDIRNVDVNIGEKKEKLHLHLNDVLLNAKDSNHFVSILPVEVKKALDTINLDSPLFLNGDPGNKIYGLIELRDLIRPKENENPVVDNGVSIDDKAAKIINDMFNDSNFSDNEKLSLLDNDKVAACLNKDTVIKLLVCGNKELETKIASSIAINSLTPKDFVSILNTGKLNGNNLSPSTIYEIASNGILVKKIGENEFAKTKSNNNATLEELERLSAERFYNVLTRAAKGKALKLGGKYNQECISGILKNEELIKAMHSNGKDLYGLLNIAIASSKKGLNVAKPALTVINGISGNESFWKLQNKAQIESLVDSKINYLEKNIASSKEASKKLSPSYAEKLIFKFLSDETVMQNGELLKRLNTVALSKLMAEQNINKNGLAKNPSLFILDQKFLDPNPNNNNFLFENVGKDVKISLASNSELFKSLIVPDSIKKRIITLSIFGNMKPETHEAISTLLSNKTAIPFVPKSKLNMFFSRIATPSVISNNDALISAVNEVFLSRSISSNKSVLSKTPGALSSLFSSEAIVAKFGTEKIKDYLKRANLPANISSTKWIEIKIGIIKNKAVTLSESELNSIISSNDSGVRAALASKPGVELIISQDQISNLANDPAPIVVYNVFNNIPLLIRYLNNT